MIYLYGLMDPGAGYSNDRLSSASGVTGPVKSSLQDAGRLIYGDHDGSEIRAKRRMLLAHTKVLELVSEQATVLPMRFGMVADSISEVAEMIAMQKEAIATQFDRLAGHVEFGLRVTYPEKPALQHTLASNPDLLAERNRLAKGADHFGNAEFGRKLGETLERSRTQAQHRLVRAVKSAVSDLILRAPENEYQVLNAHVLIKREEESGFPPILGKLTEALDFAPGTEPAVSLVGPAPLYNFVDLNLADGLLEPA